MPFVATQNEYKKYHFLVRFCSVYIITLNGLFTLPGSDSDSDSDYCTMQKFPIGLDSDSDALIEI